jgi:DNA-directed RNA polymerase specialized sigma24 family protein
VEDPELGLLCEAEWPRLVGLLRLYTGDRELAEDLAQETPPASVATGPGS